MNNDELYVDVTSSPNKKPPEIFLANLFAKYSGWPNEIVLKSITTKQAYILKQTACKDITLTADEAVGKSACGNCHKSVGISDIFCKHCGVKFTHKFLKEVD